jgi:AcrR family transcriptional regulator
VVDEVQRAVPPSLAQEQQQLTRSRIRDAAMTVVARRGFDATVAEIADISGVSARTIFRHYESHDHLIASAIKDMFEACGRGPVEGIPRSKEDLDGWLEGIAKTIHTRNAEIIGDAFWDIHAPRQNASDIFVELDAFRREYRTRGVRFLTARAWRAAGATGDPPDQLVLAFALNFSVFTTQALMIDFEQTPAEIGSVTADILKTLLKHAVAAAHAGDGETGGIGI